MSVPGTKIISHPDKDKIVELLTSGMSVKKVEQWLKDRYPGNTKMHVSWITLQAFRKQFLNLYGDALDKIKHSNEAQAINQEIKHNESLQEVKSSPAYKRAVKNIEQDYIDFKERLIDIDKVIWQRITDHLKVVQDNDESIKRDAQLEKWISQARSILQDYSKLVHGRPDSIHQHNVNINVMDDYAKSIKCAIKDVLSDMAPELIPTFIQRCEIRFREISAPDPEQEAKNTLQNISSSSIDAEFSDINNND